MNTETVLFLFCGSAYTIVCVVTAIALVRAAGRADKRRVRDVRILRWDEDADPRHWDRR